MKSRRGIIVVSVLLAAVLIIGLMYYLKNKTLSREDRIAKRRQNCIVEKTEIAVSDESLSIKKGTKVTLEKNYYRCFKGAHGDIVAFGTLKKPRFSKIQIAPDDRVKVTKVGKQFQFTVTINEISIPNRANKNGYFSIQQVGMLKTFVDNNNGVIPDDVYFVWGENIEEGIRMVYGSAILGRITL